MGYPKRLLTEGEEIVREFRPHWRMLVIPFGWTLLLGAAVVLTWIYPPDQSWFDWGVTGIAAVAWLVLGLYPLIAWFFTLYVLTNERLIRRSGCWPATGWRSPSSRSTTVTFTQTILERILHSGDLLIESPGRRGRASSSNIPEPRSSTACSTRCGRSDPSPCRARPGSRPGGGRLGLPPRAPRPAGAGRDDQPEEYEEQKKKILGEI